RGRPLPFWRRRRPPPRHQGAGHRFRQPAAVCGTRSAARRPVLLERGGRTASQAVRRGRPVSVDVVVVTHQSRPTLQAALDLLPAEARVVVVDNASSDGTLDVASPVAAQLVRNAENRGFAAAANQAAKLGRAEVLVFLNPDARIDKESLDMLVAELD